MLKGFVEPIVAALALEAHRTAGGKAAFLLQLLIQRFQHLARDPGQLQVLGVGDRQPVHVKQFRIPLAQQQFVYD